MAQKNATPSKKHQEIMRKNGINSILYVVMKELDHSIIIKHRITGDVKVLDKQEVSYG